MAEYFWNGMWLRFNQHISKYADLPILADRALDFLGATAAQRHTEKATKSYWHFLAEIYSNSQHSLVSKAGVLALLKKAQLQVDAAAAVAGTKSVELKFTALDGREVDLAKIKGKVVIIDFWATWCKPCLASMPHLKEMYDKYRDKGLEVVGICLDPGLWKGKIEENNRQQVEAAIKKFALPWPQRYTGSGLEDPFARLYGIGSLPTVWLLDKNGRIADTNACGERLEPLIIKYLE